MRYYHDPYKRIIGTKAESVPFFDLERELSWMNRKTPEQYFDLVCLARGIAFFWEKKREQNLPMVDKRTPPEWWNLAHRYAHPDSYYVGSNWAARAWCGFGTLVWTYYVVVQDWDPAHICHARMVDVYEPRVEMEPDGDESGVWYDLTASWDKVCYHRTLVPLSEEDEDLIADALRELMKHQRI